VDNGTETLLPLSNNIEYKEVVNAVYFTYSNKIKTFSYQAGLRAEHSKFDGKLLDTDKSFGYTYPDNFDRLFDALFPSLFLTKELSDRVEMQLNYSRRIRRPNFWNLNPFVDINDPLNISRGNPELRPEFTNSFEVNYNKQYGQSNNMLASIYYRNTTGDITRFSDTISTQEYQQLQEAGIEPNAILNTFINANSMNRLGAEYTLQHKFSDRFDITPTINGEYQMVDAGIDGVDLSNEGFNWEAKLIMNYKIATEKPSLFNNFSTQLIGEYESPRIEPQGRQLPEYSVDLAFRKDFLENKKASITFSINDVFWTDRDGSIYDTPNFYQESSRRNLRTFRLNFSYKFGNSDFRISRQENNRDDDD
ncbi:MAG TPA: outer membrane beta-barrel family protein, partial [Chitinophagaceae bacterium]